MGGERPALPSSVDVRLSVGPAVPLAGPASVDPDSGDTAAGCRSPAGSVSRGTTGHCVTL